MKISPETELGRDIIRAVIVFGVAIFLSTLVYSYFSDVQTCVRHERENSRICFVSMGR